jgi:hypothetical protein
METSHFCKKQPPIFLKQLPSSPSTSKIFKKYSKNIPHFSTNPQLSTPNTTPKTKCTKNISHSNLTSTPASSNIIHDKYWPLKNKWNKNRTIAGKKRKLMLSPLRNDYRFVF